MKIDELIEIADKQVESLNLQKLINSGFIPQDGMFFPSIYYPPLTMYLPSSEEDMLANYEYREEHPVALYVHIPFCATRCIFCHWVISLNASSAEVDTYLDCLDKEAVLWHRRLKTEKISPQSILIGGGTPTMLSASQTEKFLKSLNSRFDFNKCKQFSYEAEPRSLLGTEGLAKLAIMKNYGVDRISLGVNSFNDRILRGMGRPHNSEDAINAIQQIRKVGFKSLSIDLVYGYPESTIGDWIDTLMTAASVSVDAYQLYRLRIVPHGDRIGLIKKQFDESEKDFMDLKNIYRMKALGFIISSQNGFKEDFRRIFSKNKNHISFFLRDYCCRLYNVIGLGISSWSNLGDRLFLNSGESLEKYCSCIKEGKIPIDRGKIRTRENNKVRALILPLKNCGVDKLRYKETTGITIDRTFGKKIEQLKSLELLQEDKERLWLTKKGAFFADEVMMQFYAREYIPFPNSAYAAGELNPYNT